MSASAIVSIKQDSHSLHVWLEPVGTPGYVAETFVSALDYAWPLPRFEIADWAAAIVAAAKPKRHCSVVAERSNVVFCADWRTGVPPDFRYELICHQGRLHIRAFRHDQEAAGLRFEPIFSGSLASFCTFAGTPGPVSNEDRYLAIFQAPEAGLFVLAFYGTPPQAEELSERMRWLIKHRFLKDGDVITAQGPALTFPVDSVHLALDQVVAQSNQPKGDEQDD